MDRNIIDAIATDAAFLAESIARRGVLQAGIPVMVAGAMPAIAEYEIEAHATREKASWVPAWGHAPGDTGTGPEPPP